MAYVAPTKAIIAAAGFGTRFLPQTKAMPKEMMPLIDKPVIQYVVEELVEAGIKDIIIVGSSNKRAIEDHFDMPSEDLVANLKAGGAKKKAYLDEVERISELANFIYLRQKGPYGNATPIWCARHLIGDEPFMYAWADDFFVARPSSVQQMVDVRVRYGGSVLACKKVVQDAEYDKYGIVEGMAVEGAEEGTLEVRSIVERPGKEGAKGDVASVSTYLFDPALFGYLEEDFNRFSGQGEFMMQPTLDRMIGDGNRVYARVISDGKYYDTGDKLEYLKTIVDFGLRSEEFGEAFGDYLREKVG